MKGQFCARLFLIGTLCSIPAKAGEIHAETTSSAAARCPQGSAKDKRDRNRANKPVTTTPADGVIGPASSICVSRSERAELKEAMERFVREIPAGSLTFVSRNRTAIDNRTDVC